MAFTFQINNDLKFNHDKTLLDVAESCSPKIYKKDITAKDIVDVVSDATKLDGFGIVSSNKDISSLKEYGLKRDDKIILDFKEHCVGTFRIDIDQIGSPMDAPLYIRLKFAEMPTELMSESSDYDGWLSRSWIQEEFIHIDTLPMTLELPRRYSFRFVEIKVIDTSPKWQVVFSHPVATTVTSADYSRLESLHLEDETLQKIYDVSVKTLADCMQNVFEDGPKRDRRLWLGDLRLQALANYATFDQTELVKRCIYLFAGMTAENGKISANVFVEPNIVPDDTFLYEYSLFLVSTLYDYYQRHPDMTMIKQIYPICKKQMDVTLSMFDKEGKLVPDEDYPVFVDWSNEFNKDTAGQAETIYVLKQFIYLAKLVNDNEIEKYEKYLQKITDYALNHLFNEEKNLFVSGNNEYNLASQVWMVLAHIMSDEKNKSIMQTAIKAMFPIKGIATPYMYHHIVEALFEADLKDEAIDLMKKYWGKMIELGADTFWEAFDPTDVKYSPYGSSIVNSYCHAWSCTPAYIIKKYIVK